MYIVFGLIVPLELLLLHDQVVGFFSRYTQAMLKNICNGSVSPGINGGAVDSPVHDCLSWLTPPEQLEGRNRDCTRPLRCVVKKADEKCAGNIEYVASGWTSKRRVVKAALRKGLRTRCNRRRTSARMLAYRTLGVYMDNDDKEASKERVVITTGVHNASEAAELAALATPGSVSYRLKLNDRARELLGGPALGEFLVPSCRHIGDTPRSSVANVSRRGANCVGNGSTMGARRQRISIRPCRIQDRLTQGLNALKSGIIGDRTSPELMKTYGDLLHT